MTEEVPFVVLQLLTADDDDDDDGQNMQFSFLLVSVAVYGRVEDGDL